MFEITAVSSGHSFGSCVEGLTMRDLADPGIRHRLNDLWSESGLLVFRNCEASSEFQIKLSRVFGEIERHPVREYWVEGFPELIGLSADEFMYNVDGKTLGGWIPWHVDTIYTTKLCRGGLLRALRVPSEGGETGLADRAEAYDALPAKTKARIANLEIIYRFSNNLQELPYCTRSTFARIGKTDRQQAVEGRQTDDFKKIVYPLVYDLPYSRRRVLNISPMFALEIKGMLPKESHALISELIDYATDASRVYLHKWQVGDQLLWDNWRMVHKACGTTDASNREMHRTTIAGDWELGRELQ